MARGSSRSSSRRRRRRSDRGEQASATLPRGKHLPAGWPLAVGRQLAQRRAGLGEVQLGPPRPGRCGERRAAPVGRGVDVVEIGGAPRRLAPRASEPRGSTVKASDSQAGGRVRLISTTMTPPDDRTASNVGAGVTPFRPMTRRRSGWRSPPRSSATGVRRRGWTHERSSSSPASRVTSRIGLATGCCRSGAAARRRSRWPRRASSERAAAASPSAGRQQPAAGRGLHGSSGSGRLTDAGDARRRTGAARRRPVPLDREGVGRCDGRAT